MRWVWAPLLALLPIVPILAGCPSPRAPDPVRTPEERLADYARAFRRAEPVLLGALAVSDPRIAHRFTDAPRLGGRFADPFLFDARARVVEHVALEAQRIAVPAFLLPETGPMSAHRLEQELLFRTIDEEQARVDSERALPASAADLLRATSLAWPSILPHEEQRATQSIVGWRLDQVRASLAPNALSALEREDLLDAVGELERAVDRAPAPYAEMALRNLRSDLETLRVAPFELRGWRDLAAPLRVHVGVTAPEEEIRRRTRVAIGILLAQIGVAFEVLGQDKTDAIRRSAAEDVARAPECGVVPSLQGLRALAPPPERAWACVAVRVGAARGTELDEITALVALHDLATVGMWALDLHGERRDPEAARAAHPLLARLDDARTSRLLRDAATHPVGPIGAALAVSLLLARGPAHLRERAAAWETFGDAPLDIVERELFTRSDVPR